MSVTIGDLAGPSLFLREIATYLMSSSEDVISREEALECYNFINSNNHFFLNLVLGACKCMADETHEY